MKHIERKCELLSVCGLNCGLCPRYYTDGVSKCPGCAVEEFFAKKLSCGVISCCRSHGIEYCYQCDEYPCKRYDGAGVYDSFITHRNQLKDFEKAKRIGLDAYKAELDEKVQILQNLLDNYNAGRQKSLYCIAVNLLELADVKEVMVQLEEAAKPDCSIKEKALAAASLFKKMAQKRDISLKLNKPESSKK